MEIWSQVEKSERWFFEPPTPMWRRQKPRKWGLQSLQSAVQSSGFILCQVFCCYKCYKIEQPMQVLPFSFWLVFWRTLWRTDGELSFRACLLAHLHVATWNFYFQRKYFLSQIIYIVSDTSLLLLDLLKSCLQSGIFQPSSHHLHSHNGVLPVAPWLC